MIRQGHPSETQPSEIGHKLRSYWCSGCFAARLGSLRSQIKLALIIIIFIIVIIIIIIVKVRMQNNNLGCGLEFYLYSTAFHI